MKKKTGCVTLLALGIAAAGTLYVWTHYRGWRFTGDADLQDNGVISYPRYIARFPSIDLAREGSHEYRFRNFPADTAVLMLKTRTSLPTEQLESSTTFIKATLHSAKGTTACLAQGRPNANADAERWYVTSTPKYAVGLWHMSCNGVNLGACGDCRLSLSVDSPDRRIQSLVVQPALEGGGVEFP
jgi:hypothetical protein